MQNKKDFIKENKEVEIFTQLNMVEVPIEKVNVSGGKKQLEEHKSNPYREDLLMSVKYGTKSIHTIGNDEPLYDKHGNQQPLKRVVMKNEVVDKDKFVKVYVENIAEMFDLPKYAYKLFHYILQQIEQGTDEIYLYPKDVCVACEWKSTNQFDKALIVLTHRRFLAKSYRTYWWYINPTIFFNGDRVAFIRMIRKVNTEQGKLELGDGED